MDIRKPVPTIYGYFHEKYGAFWAEQMTTLSSHAAIEKIFMPVESPVDMPTVFVKKSNAHEFLKELKETYHYSFLTDYTATDEQGDEAGVIADSTARFHLVIHLMNVENKARIRVKIRIQENETFPTLIPIWPGADWAEREIFDMFGIHFEGHPDLRRILMDMRWEGHPLRKDYPLRGYQIFLTPEPLDPELLK